MGDDSMDYSDVERVSKGLREIEADSKTGQLASDIIISNLAKVSADTIDALLKRIAELEPKL